MVIHFFTLGEALLKSRIGGSIIELKKRAPILPKTATEYFVNTEINELKKKFTTSKVSGINLTNNEIKDIGKVINFFQNLRILLKGTTEKGINQKGGFIVSLMTFGLPLLKNILTPLVKNSLMSLGVTAAMSTTEAAIQKKPLGWGTSLITSNKEMDEIMKNFTLLENLVY